jgi:hypothetical protein
MARERFGKRAIGAIEGEADGACAERLCGQQVANFGA